MSLIIRKMELAELEIATYLAYKEGWNPGHADGWAFYHQDPNGFFIAELNSEIVGCISAVKYSNNYGFIGFYIVTEEHRNDIIGTRLGLRALNHLKSCNIGIDGVINRVENYKRLGFNFAYKNARFEGVGSDYSHSDKIVRADTINKNSIYEYDFKYFQEPRKEFLDAWLKMPNAYTNIYFENNEILGYGTIRPCRIGFKIGPLFAENYEIANELYKSLAHYAIDELLYLDIPSINEDAKRLAKNYDMKMVFETARMYSKVIPDIDTDKIFGITTFELG